MSLRPKRGIAGLKTCLHGGIDHAQLKAAGLKPDGVLDFSVCTNPFMPPPGIREMLGAIPIERYPDSEATEFREALSASLGVPAENILAGSGTTELIRLIAAVYFRRGDTVLLLEPTYGDYQVACRLEGTRLVRYRATEENSFAPVVADVAGLVRKHRPRGVFICNPNNPTGKYLSRQEIETVLDAGGDSLLVLDEAYLAFVAGGWSSVDLVARGNVVMLRSMTKDYGLPGLRLGYAIAHQEITRNLRRVCPPWNVNMVAQEVGVAVLKSGAYLEESCLKVREAKQFLSGGLARLGFKVLPSDANYFLVKVGDARSFRDALLRRGIIVRDCSSFGLPEYVRIAPRTLPECARLIEAVGSMPKLANDIK